jgi:hypothetical protein
MSTATTPTPSRATVSDLGATIVERDLCNGLLLRFEEAEPGQWMTKAGQPAKRARRSYTLGAVELDSVSSIVGCLEKQALYGWHEDMGARGAAAAASAGELDGVPEGEIIQRVRQLGLGAEARRGEAADRGKAIHAVFERFARDGEPPNPADFPPEWLPWIRGATTAWLALGAEPLESEEIVCDPDRGYAGRFDLLGLVDEQRTLVDYKTGKGKIYPEAHYQTRLYADAIEACGCEPVERIIIVGVDDQGGFELVECVATREDCEALLAVARSRKRVAEAISAQRAVARKAAKAAAA